MPDRRQVTGAQAVAAFRRLGFQEVRVNGSHHILKKPGHRLALSVPVHRGRNLGRGLLNSLLQAANVTRDEFFDQVR